LRVCNGRGRRVSFKNFVRFVHVEAHGASVSDVRYERLQNWSSHLMKSVVVDRALRAGWFDDSSGEPAAASSDDDGGIIRVVDSDC